MMRVLNVPRSAVLLALIASVGGCGEETASPVDAGKIVAIEIGGGPTQEEIAANWGRFRGPGGLGVSAYTNVPETWDGATGENMLWKTPVPLSGKNSPIVWGDRVFVTGADREKREVYCFNADSGELLWQQAVGDGERPEPPPTTHDLSGYAASTAATDGKLVYVIFPTGHIASFDYEGDLAWERRVDLSENIYAHAASLVLYHNLLMVQLDLGNADDDLSRLMALDVETGKTAWEVARPVAGSWTTPIIIDTRQREELITSAKPWVIAHDPTDGRELWRANCVWGDSAPSPVYVNGMIHVANIYASLVAIRPGGEGDVTESHILWSAEGRLPDICSPASNGELVFVLSTQGVLGCYDTVDGTMLWTHDCRTRFSASPSLVGDELYLLSESGTMFIVAAKREYEELRRAELGESATTCPAFVNGRIYIRGKTHLYCIEASE